MEMKPQLGKLKDFSIRYHNPHGSVLISSSGPKGARSLSWEIEGDWELELLLPEEEEVSLKSLKSSEKGWKRYRGGKKEKLSLKYT